ncbi:hypothetical protein DFA_04963 [Cavenderia fasciculata]|uniref:GYF domain-containing protein n=1 Tax=Cavenderia fasciculata TaxID=261658 RepID=F4PMN6_CACFS|nr:uncharacterized protein DFA_04963 [Cavenderia fasciculata]EGG22833.1 hypothetical protein DFA_04963 [Cavenderia fasciculata]|eukprot:XP_004360684.1 hypothetical protein DFA_04963 [Cavenderia fasciculata]
MNNHHKRKANDGDDDGVSDDDNVTFNVVSDTPSQHIEKKVRFRVEEETSNNNSDNNNNNNSNNNKILDDEFERKILEQMKKGDEKQKRRDAEEAQRKKLFRSTQGLREAGKEVVSEDGVIRKVEGEIDDDDNQYDNDQDQDMNGNGERHISDKFSSGVATIPSDWNRSSSKTSSKTSSSKRNEDSDDDNDGEEDDEDENDKDRQEVNGEVEIMPFNLHEERERGRFKEDGTYQREDQDREEDAWLREYDKTNKLPKLSKKEIEKSEMLGMDDDDEDQWDKEDNDRKKQSRSVEARIAKKQALTTVLDILLDGETVTSAIRRLGSSTKKPIIKKKNQNQKQTTNDTTKTAIDVEREQLKQESFSKLTTAVDYLLSNGFINIYQDKKENVQNYYNRDFGDTTTTTNTTTSTTNSTQKWEYKGLDGNIYGPFGNDEMREWKAGGFFTGQNVICRIVGAPETTFKLIDDIQF